MEKKVNKDVLIFVYSMVIVASNILKFNNINNMIFISGGKRPILDD